MRFQKLPSFPAILACLGIFAAFLGVSPSHALAQAVKLDDLIARHLESLGTADSRRAMENFVISGVGAVACQRGCVGSLQGPATVASAMGKRIIAMKFESLTYPGERFLFNGKSVDVARLPEGKYTVLGVFFYDNRVFLGEGLLGGALTQGWPLLDLEARKPRLSYRGLEKVDGRRLHDVEFRPRSGRNDFIIHLYFEPDTFRHVVTRYATALSGLSEDTVPHRIVERFTDFAAEGGLTLPHGYELQFDGPSHQVLWRMRLDKFQSNSEIDPAMFEVAFSGN